MACANADRGASTTEGLYSDRFAFVTGITRTESVYVLMPLGILVLAIGVWRNRHEKAVKYGLCWGIAVVVYYLIAARTSSAQWAAYYHIVSVPPAAILFGNGVVAIHYLKTNKRWLRILIALSGMLALVLSLSIGLLLSGTWLWISLAIPATFALTALVLLERVKNGVEGG